MKYKIKIGDVTIYYFDNLNDLNKWCNDIGIQQEPTLGWYIYGTLNQIDVVWEEIKEFIKSKENKYA